MADVSMVDVSGRPESDDDIRNAIQSLKTYMVKHALVMPMLTVYAPTAIHGLEELLAVRKLIREQTR